MNNKDIVSLFGQQSQKQLCSNFTPISYIIAFPQAYVLCEQIIHIVQKVDGAAVEDLFDCTIFSVCSLKKTKESD